MGEQLQRIPEVLANGGSLDPYDELDPRSALAWVRRRLEDLVATRSSGCWTSVDEHAYRRLATREASLLDVTRRALEPMPPRD